MNRAERRLASHSAWRSIWQLGIRSTNLISAGYSRNPGRVLVEECSRGLGEEGWSQKG